MLKTFFFDSCRKPLFLITADFVCLTPAENLYFWTPAENLYFWTPAENLYCFSV